MKKLLCFCLVLLFAVTAVLPAVGADEAKTKTLGDVNGDGVINTEDALMVLQSVVGITELDENAAKAADVNSDEKIDTQDALGILQYVVGIRAELPYTD